MQTAFFGVCNPNMGWEQSAGENVPAAVGIGYLLLERHGAGTRPAPTGVLWVKLAASFQAYEADARDALCGFRQR